MTQTNRVLTLQTLVQKGVCPSQRKLFKKLFGNSVNITPELCAGVAKQFNWDWAAKYLLSAKAWAAYTAASATACAEYRAAIAPAWAAYEAATAAYEAATAAYRAAAAEVDAEYRAATAPAWAAYEVAAAKAWAEAYINDWEA
jgi:hypothetical protein